jgi:hypothetical protein
LKTRSVGMSQSMCAKCPHPPPEITARQIARIGSMPEVCPQSLKRSLMLVLDRVFSSTRFTITAQ